MPVDELESLPVVRGSRNDADYVWVPVELRDRILAALTPPADLNGLIERLKDTTSANQAARLVPGSLAAIHADLIAEAAAALTSLAAEQDAAVKAERERFSKLELWFFRDCNEGTRRCLFALFGLPLDEIRNQGAERAAFRHIFAQAIRETPDGQ